MRPLIIRIIIILQITNEGFPVEYIHMFTGCGNENTFILGAEEKGKGIFDVRLKITDAAL